MKTSKQMTNLEIAELLRAVAAAYGIRDQVKNKFRIVAYQRAADAVEHSTSELKDIWEEGRLEEVPGVGPNIAAHLEELFKTGRVGHFAEVLKGFDPQMFELMKVPGVGPKTAYKMVNSGEIPEETKTALKKIKEQPKRQLLPHAMAVTTEIMEWMKQEKAVARIEPLGSLRRWAATIGDIDLAVATEDFSLVLDRFAKYPKAQKVLEKGDTTAAIEVAGGVRVDLMVQKPGAYGALLQHFTGSKHHNIALREFSLKQGLSLSEHGIKSLKSGKTEEFAREEEFYGKLGLEWIPPELREDGGEIEAAGAHKLPDLVELSDIKGDLQIHSNFDIETSHDLGQSSMEEIVEKAKELGYEYIGFSEHNPSKSKHSEKEVINLLKRKEVKIREKDWGIKVFNSLEIDMLPEGGLPVPEEGLATLDFALVSIHSSFELNRIKMTTRVLKSLEHPKAKIFAHPTTRLLNRREGVELDWPAIFEFCLQHKKWIEINADPSRLDLPDTLVREAVKAGVRLTLGTDSHHVEGLNNMLFGVSVARRGWARASDIMNTRGLKEFELEVSKQ